MKVDYSKAAKQSVLDRKYINDISEISGIPINIVKKVFETYFIYLLHDIAISPEPKDFTYITIPGFSTIKISRTNHKNSKHGIQMHMVKGVKDNYKPLISNAFLNNHDYLRDHILSEFGNLIKDRINSNEG